MKPIIADPIVAEIRAARDEHVAQFGYDLKEVFRDIKKRQKLSGREYVTYTPRRSALTPSTK